MKKRKATAPKGPIPHALPAVRANTGIEAWYRKQLDTKIREMQDSLTYWLKAKYRATMANDAADGGSQAMQLRKSLRTLGKQWQTVFDDLALKLSRNMVDRVLTRTDNALSSALRNEGMTVKFTMTESMNNAYQAVIGENVGLIRSIASEHLSDVEGLVMRSVARGRDLGQLSKDLQARYGITKRRAALISRDQNAKATSVLTATRQQGLGITQGVWKHSHAGRVPRPSHVAANNTVFDLSRGLYLDGEWVMPGQAINCLPGSASIENATGCKKLWRRWYDGKLTKLVTDSGEFLEATPNHPVLTGRGWIPIGLVNLGEDVFSVSDQVIFGSEKDVDDSGHGIAKIFDLAALHVGVNTSASTAFKFHGDAINQEVDTVYMAGFLPDDFSAKHAQAICESFFPDAYMAIVESGLSVDGTHAAAFSRLFCSPDRVIRGFSACLSLLRGHLTHADDVCLRLSARLNACKNEAASDYLPTNMEGFGEREFTFASFVPGNDVLIRQLVSLISAASVGWSANTASAEFLGEIVGMHSDSSSGIGESLAGTYKPLRVVDKSFRNFSGHVYNLETATGWYSSRGLVYHNCRCTWSPVIPGLTD